MTDQLADLLFTPAEDGDINLQREGIPAEKIYRVGNVMIDFSYSAAASRYAIFQE